jgi:hypothetical protein
MKALIFNNKVVQLEESEFPVAPELTWMDAPDGCEVKWTLEDGVLVAPPDPPEKTWDQKRQEEYPDIGDQLDDLYHKGAFSDEMAVKIKAVKDAHPKPE